MDVRQYGPALFPSVKQVRRMLDEDQLRLPRTRPESNGDPASSSYDDSRAGIGK
jgi:hypothetical protein